MKKNYMSPACREYKVNTSNLFATSPLFGSGEVEGSEMNTKEEKTSGSGIWDLYN